MREHVDPDGELKTAVLVHVKSEDQSADIFTKTLTGPLFASHRECNLGEKRKSTKEVIASNQRKRR